jgi:hypothetical protein
MKGKMTMIYSEMRRRHPENLGETEVFGYEFDAKIFPSYFSP